MEKKEKTKGEKKYVLGILKTNPENLIWIAYIFIASISFIISIINIGLEEFKNGPFYYISMSIVAPLLIDFLIQTIESKKSGTHVMFLGRKITILVIGVIHLFLSFIFVLTRLCDIIWLQSVMLFVSILLSLYMFCLNKLHLRYEEYKGLDDKSYADEMKEKVNELSEKPDNIKSVKNDKGEDIKL